MRKIPAIIPFYKDRAALERSVACLRQSRGVQTEVFIRDNTDDNILFTAAVNEGLLRYAFDAGYDYTAVVNQDLYLEADALQTLAGFMDAVPQCGIACPMQLSLSNPARVTWAGSLHSFPTGRHRVGDRQSFRDAEETPWANGACMLLRNRMVKEIGLLDPNMRFVCSDVDYSFTARARRWKVFVVPAALAHHDFGASDRKHRSASIDLVKAQDFAYFAEKWITGRLFRTLEFDAGAVTDDVVARWIGHLDKVRKDLRTKLGA